MTVLTDMTGKQIELGHTVIYAVSSEYAGELHEAEVVKVDSDKKRITVAFPAKKWVYVPNGQSYHEDVIQKVSQPWNGKKFRIIN